MPASKESTAVSTKGAKGVERHSRETSSPQVLISPTL